MEITQEQLAAMLAQAAKAALEAITVSSSFKESIKSAVDASKTRASANKKKLTPTRADFFAHAREIKITLEGENIPTGKCEFTLSPGEYGKPENLQAGESLILGWVANTTGKETVVLAGLEVPVNISLNQFARGSKKWEAGDEHSIASPEEAREIASAKAPALPGLVAGTAIKVVKNAEAA